MSSEKKDWRIFHGDGKHLSTIKDLPEPPPWRQFQRKIDSETMDKGITYWNSLKDTYPYPPPTSLREGSKSSNKITESSGNIVEASKKNTNENNIEHPRVRSRGQTFYLNLKNKDHQKIIDAVNAALYLRRPLLVTGKPGTGKTSLAYAITNELQLGPVLKWPITTRSTLEEGLYQYDALGRLQAIQEDALTQQQQQTNTSSGQNGESHNTRQNSDSDNNIGEFIRLGPLGTAFLPTPYPRVLLIDEIDKSDINLPNDLLDLLEEGEFEIPVLKRLAKRSQQQPIGIRTADDDLDFKLKGGKVICKSFPLIVMTSNDERDFPPAFLRRCLQVIMQQPEREDLEAIVKAHLGEKITQEISDLITEFAGNREAVNRATDQLLNAVFMRTHIEDKVDIQGIKDLLFTSINNTQSNR